MKDRAGMRGIVTSSDKKRPPGVGLNLNAEVHGRGMVFVLLPGNVALDSFRMIREDGFELGVGQ
jgi:hypothetical protein